MAAYPKFTPDDQLDLLFPADIVPSELREGLPDDLHIRPLASTDYSRGHLDVLSVLTTVADVGEETWRQRFEQLKLVRGTYFCLVIVNKAEDRIVATGTVMLECKFIRSCGLCGHIEDIAVDSTMQGKKLGRRIIDALTAVSERLGAYKTILDCSQDNVPFYKKCGYDLKGAQMAKYIPERVEKQVEEAIASPTSRQAAQFLRNGDYGL